MRCSGAVKHERIRKEFRVRKVNLKMRRKSAQETHQEARGRPGSKVESFFSDDGPLCSMTGFKKLI